MSVNWTGLGTVLAAGFVASIVVVAVYAVGIRQLDVARTARERGDTAVAATTLAWLCFTVALAAVGYGLYILLPW